MEEIKVFAKNEKLESLIQTTRTFSQDIGMKFANEKCTRFIMKKEKQLKE